MQTREGELTYGFTYTQDFCRSLHQQELLPINTVNITHQLTSSILSTTTGSVLEDSQSCEVLLLHQSGLDWLIYTACTVGLAQWLIQDLRINVKFIIKGDTN